jgi:Uma2 family endonuclease
MATVTILGPADHGRPMSLEDFESYAAEEGYRYELIDGRVYVSPQPDMPQNSIEVWLHQQLFLYSMARPDVINYLTTKARIFVPGRKRTTCPEPDLAAYHDFPTHLSIRQRRWQDHTPILVAEIVSDDDPDKDLVRNVELYLQVPSIREYWVIDPREDADRPTLLVYRRRGRRWQRTIEVAAGATYATRLLPGFELLIDPLGSP